MRKYRLKLDSIIQGTPLEKGRIIGLSEDDAAPFVKAGLLEPYKDDGDKPAARDTKPAKAASTK